MICFIRCFTLALLFVCLPLISNAADPVVSEKPTAGQKSTLAADKKAEPSKPASKEKSVSQTPADMMSASVEQIAQQAKPSLAEISYAGRDGSQKGIGTGFVISADGLIATNLHVIGEARPITVQMADGRKLKVEQVLASDRFLDLAVLKVDANDLIPLSLGDSSQVSQGQPVVVMGNPQGLKHSVVSGVISAEREIEGRKMLQLAIPIEPGNSGGPVLDMQGRVLGVVTMKSLVTNNLGFAVSINSLKPLLEKPNPIPMSRWLTIGAIDRRQWTPLFGARWQQRAGKIVVDGTGAGFGGRSLCLSRLDTPELPFEIAVSVRMDDEKGAAGIIFHSDGGDRHYGFYPSNGKLRLSCFKGPNVFTWQVLRDEPNKFYRPGEWNRLKVRIESKKMICYINGQVAFESTDKTFTSGKVGLAKFRQTNAEFKSFSVAKEIPSTALPKEKLEQINKLIDQLPSLESIVDQSFKSLSDDPAASVELLRKRADSLEKRADELRRTAFDIHVRGITAQLSSLSEAKEEDIDLLHSALLIAQIDDEEIEIDAYLRQVDRMAEDVKQTLKKDASEKDKLAALNKYLFAENGFHGSRTDYYHRANSYLSRVIDDREGLPVTLSVLYIELCRRLGLEVVGVGLPGHFVVAHLPIAKEGAKDENAKQGERQLIDVFEGGKMLSRGDAAEIVKTFANIELTEEHLRPAGKKEILLRILRNLRGISERTTDRESILHYLDALLALDKGLVPERGMRAILRYETGRRDAALADLDWFLENKTKGLDLIRIRQMRDFFELNTPQIESR